MGLNDRIRKLEGPLKPERCPECAGRIVYAEHQTDGTVDYPGGGPCSTCLNRPADGTVGLIEVMPTDNNVVVREEPQGPEKQAEVIDAWP